MAILIRKSDKLTKQFTQVGIHSWSIAQQIIGLLDLNTPVYQDVSYQNFKFMEYY